MWPSAEVLRRQSCTHRRAALRVLKDPAEHDAVTSEDLILANPLRGAWRSAILRFYPEFSSDGYFLHRSAYFRGDRALASLDVQHEDRRNGAGTLKGERAARSSWPPLEPSVAS